jgi:hypothetical protein
MLQNLPNGQATTIDKWANYNEKDGYNEDVYHLKHLEEINVEKIFYDNIEKAGVKNRINALKGDSTSILFDLIKQNKIYNIIYVDGSHKCMDCYTDCILAWQILDKNGLLIIDDYLYRLEADVFDIPFHAVNRFLEKKIGTYTILEKGYRVFLLKN